jgi:uncharacterized protein YkwD
MLMSWPRHVVLAALALALLVAPAAGAQPTVVRPQAEGSLLDVMNDVRAAHGLQPLRLDARLRTAARSHTRHMVAHGYFAHGAFGERMDRFAVGGPRVGENLAWGSGRRGSARGIVAAWLASPGHRANLLRPGFARVGLGVVAARFAGVANARVVTADFAGT